MVRTRNPWLGHRYRSLPARARAGAAAFAAALVAGLVLVPFGGTPAYAAAVINVPGDQPTIQAAVAAAATGDTILIAPGTYTGGALVQDKALTFASWYATTGNPAYIEQTVLTGYVSNYCGGASGCAGDAVLEFGSRAGGSVVNGLTIMHGMDGVAGNSKVDIQHSRMIANEDGIDFANGSSGTFTDDVFASNTDDGLDLNGRVTITLRDSVIQENQGDGIEFRMYPYVGDVLPVNILHNRFVRNDSDAIQLIDSDGLSSRYVRIERNTFDHDGAAAVGCLPNQQTNEDFSAAALAERVYFTNNTVSGDRYGISGGGNSIVLNNIFTGITATALHKVGGASISAYNLFWNNGLVQDGSVLDTATSVTADPLLAADLTLPYGSPAVDAGTAAYQWNGEQVLSIPGDAYSGAAPDLGASEYSSGGPAPNRPPVVSAGVDLSVALPAAAVLDGTVTDDGLPAPVTTTWSQLSGPGVVAFADAAAVDTTATFSGPGVYVLALSASDGELSASDTVQVTVAAPPAPGAATLERRIAASADDVEESAAGSYYATSTDLELVYDGSNQVVGLRFVDLAIPAGATITSAYVRFEADEVQSEATALTIQAQAADNAAAFTSATKPSTRPRTGAAVSWAPPAWTVVGAAGAEQRTPDLSALVQEVVGRVGWASGNALILIITGTGHRTARAYDGKPAGAPLIHIEYTIG